MGWNRNILRTWLIVLVAVLVLLAVTGKLMRLLLALTKFSFVMILLAGVLLAAVVYLLRRKPKP
jgi:hypothetical protein